MIKIIFELSNLERKYLGLSPIEEDWELVQYNEIIFVYYKNNIIKKRIIIEHNSYYESELNFETAENRSILLPRTLRGKPKRLTPSAIKNLNSQGTYFHYYNNKITIGNSTTQKTYYSSTYQDKDYVNFVDLKDWLDNWIRDSSDIDLKEIQAFSLSNLQHFKYNEGDFFRFKIGRRKYGFGRILLNVNKIRKKDNKDNPTNYWYNTLMGTPLLVKIYHVISNDKIINLDILRNLKCLPSQYIMDNIFYYGECELIGNLTLNDIELDFPIHFGRSISCGKENEIHFQKGLLAKKSSVHEVSQFFKNENISLNYINNFFSYNSIGFNLNYKIDILLNCIIENSNRPYWESNFIYTINKDLRNPIHSNIRKTIYDFFKIGGNTNE